MASGPLESESGYGISYAVPILRFLRLAASSRRSLSLLEDLTGLP